MAMTSSPEAASFLEVASVCSRVPEVTSIGSSVPEVAIRRICVAKLSQPEACLRPLDMHGSHKHLATLANRHDESEQVRFAHAQRL